MARRDAAIVGLLLYYCAVVASALVALLRRRSPVGVPAIERRA
jgi:hypothetical protein